MFSNHSVLDLPTCGYSDAFVKRFIKKKPIDDMLENDFPDPWYISSHIVIASEHLPWLQSPPPPVPTGNKSSSSVLPRRRTNKKRTTPVRTSSKLLQQRPLPPLPTTPTTPTTSSSETTTALPALPSPSSSSSRPSSTIRGKQQSTETIMQWMDQRLSQRSLSRSSPNNSIVQLQQQQPYKPSVAPSRAPSIATTTTTTRPRRSSSLSNEVSRVLASLPVSSSTLMSDQQQQQQQQQPHQQQPQNGHRGGSSSSNSSLAVNNRKLNKFDAAEWPHVLSQTTDEQDRMVAQHYILRTAFDGDFAAPIRTTLLDKGAVVLDIGCGPGTWCMEMATEFPRSTFIGIDRVSHYPRDIKPKNCIFRTCNIQNLPLPFPDNSVDYIFQRDLNWDLQAHQWSPLVREFLRVLKPGGWIELVEPDLETQSSTSQECAMNDKLIYGISMRHQDPYVSRHLSSILAANGFRRVESQFQSLPLGWTSKEEDDDDACNARLAKAAASQHMFTLQSLRPWLSAVMGNMSVERYNNYISELPAEWKRGHTYIHWHRAVGQKPPSKLR